MQCTTGMSLTINAAKFFRDVSFIQWLNNGTPKMTWHQGGHPSEWSDVIVLVDPSLNGEGTDSDMPAPIWEKIIDVCKVQLGPQRTGNHIPVRLVNLE